jgi:hypothetical protein
MLNRGWQRLRRRFSIAQIALVAMATVVGTAAGLYQGLSLWQIVVILIAMAAGIWPFVAIGLWIVRGYAHTGEASD